MLTMDIQYQRYIFYRPSYLLQKSVNMVLHVTARKLICADIEVAIVTSQIIFHSHTISVYSNAGTIMLN